MRKKLLIALALGFVFSLGIVLTRNSSLSLFVQGISQLLFRAPKVALYHFSVSAAEEDDTDRLREEIRLLKERLVELDHIKKDNVALKSQFEEESIDSSKLIPAQVVGFQGSINNPEILIVDKGTADGVSAGHPVVVGKNLVGVVNTASKKYSSVTVVTNVEFSTVAKTNEKNTLGVVSGGGEFLLFDRVAITDVLEKGNIVLTRGTVEGERGGIPPDLVIGSVTTIRKVASEPFQAAQVKSMLDISRLSRVFIMHE